MTWPGRSSSCSGGPPWGTSATLVPGASSNASSGTRKMAPADARKAFEPSGSAQPSESAIAAPNASAARSSVPTLPGSETRQSASVVSRDSRGRAAVRKTPTTRAGWGSVETAASNSGSMLSPATRSSIGSIPAAAAASIRSSPSTAKSPSSSRLRFCARSFRTSFSVGFDADVIRRLRLPWTTRARPSPARRRP